MRFRAVYVTTFSLFILFVLLLLGQQSVASELTLSILFGITIIVQLLFILTDDFSATHGFVTATLFLSLVYLVLNLMGPATLTTFFLGGAFILLYLLNIAMILIHNWRRYSMFDRMIESMSKEEVQRPKAPPVVPVEYLVEEPPHVRLRQDDEDEWVEIKVKKATRAAKKSTKKKARTKK